MDGDTLAQFSEIASRMREIIYSIHTPEHMLFDLDSTLLNTYGAQEGEGFNFHYQAHGYHPLLCYDGITGDLLKAELREGTQYCSKEADTFMIPLMQEYRTKYPSMPLYLRGDSGFASPDLYKACEENDCKYAIRLLLRRIRKRRRSNCSAHQHDDHKGGHQCSCSSEDSVDHCSHIFSMPVRAQIA